MKNYKLLVQYEGTKYNGWQRQKNTRNTIEERFENVLSQMARRKVEVFASGRTDAGVHARGQVVSFSCETEKSPEEIRAYLNRYLPRDVRVLSLEEAPERFHARLCARRKTYEYALCAGEKADVFSRRTMYEIEEMPDVEAMQRAAQKFLGTHDFQGFSSVKRTKKSTERTIYGAEVERQGNRIVLRITGSGFLYHMVRIMAGTLLAIGLGEKTDMCIDEIFRTKDRSLAGKTLPAEGLCLMEVQYD